MLKNATNSASMQVIKIAGWPGVIAISSTGICWYPSTFAPLPVRKLNKIDFVGGIAIFIIFLVSLHQIN